MKLSSLLYFAGFGLRTILLRRSDPIVGTVILTDKCNLHCKHCSVNNRTATIQPYARVKADMETLFRMGVRILFFCGGETFLWSDDGRTLRDLVLEARRMGFRIVNVVTNGTLSADLPEADLVLLSLDGDRERHNEIRGDTYDTILANVAAAPAGNVCLYMATIHDGAVVAEDELEVDGSFTYEFDAANSYMLNWSSTCAASCPTSRRAASPRRAASASSSRAAG